LPKGLSQQLDKSFQIRCSLHTEAHKSAGACSCKVCYQGRDKAWFQLQYTEECQKLTKTHGFPSIQSMWLNLMSDTLPGETCHYCSSEKRKGKIWSYNL